MLGQIAQILDPIAPMRDAGAVARRHLADVSEVHAIDNMRQIIGDMARIG